jgi:hypothetical protein
MVVGLREPPKVRRTSFKALEPSADRGRKKIFVSTRFRHFYLVGNLFPFGRLLLEPPTLVDLPPLAVALVHLGSSGRRNKSLSGPELSERRRLVDLVSYLCVLPFSVIKAVLCFGGGFAQRSRSLVNWVRTSLGMGLGISGSKPGSRNAPKEALMIMFPWPPSHAFSLTILSFGKPGLIRYSLYIPPASR